MHVQISGCACHQGSDSGPHASTLCLTANVVLGVARCSIVRSCVKPPLDANISFEAQEESRVSPFMSDCLYLKLMVQEAEMQIDKFGQ